MPDFLGRSAYLTEFEKQKAPLARLPGSVRCFYLAAHRGRICPGLSARVRAMCGWLREHGWRILPMYRRVTARQFGCGDIAALSAELGLWGLRLDDGFTLARSLRPGGPNAGGGQCLHHHAGTGCRPGCGRAGGHCHPQFLPPGPETGLDPAFLHESTGCSRQPG